ncbi:hypothetical protein [Nonomuraea basaltis]|uniref:hypothetical protein n=1 Tax=Nonomuraea basaltis TaxID=2495887 RepID=UPI001F113758|nr:hypothetical protein [Nonomuraea basaltis]
MTGTSAERYITDHVFRKAGLRHTSLPRTPYLPGHSSKEYEALFGLFDPPKDYSVYNMSWAVRQVLGARRGRPRHADLRVLLRRRRPPVRLRRQPEELPAARRER